MNRVVIGIDPGKSGGIAWRINNEHPKCIAMPTTLGDLINLMKEIQQEESIVVLEKVHAMPKQGVVSVWTFAQNFGEIRAVVQTLGMRLEMVTPSKWMKYFGMKKDKTETKIQWKNRLKSKACELYPNCKVTLKTADALLLLEYASPREHW